MVLARTAGLSMSVRYRLDYQPCALDDLAELYLNPPSGTTGDDVEWAANELEKHLRIDAHLNGTVIPQPDGSVDRRCTQYPLAVEFVVSEDDCQVNVLRFSAAPRVP
jgi:hypothetical protein